MKPKIIILGAGYGGLTTSLILQKELHSDEADITLVNKHSYHYITTHLHQSAAGTKSTDRIKIDLGELINPKKISFIKAEVKKVDIKTNQEVYLNNGQILDYDLLIIALGSEIETYGIEGLKENTFSIRSVNTVQLIKEHIDYMFAKYKAKEAKPEYLTFVVGGAGFTGIELLGELTDRIPVLCKKFNINPKSVRVINIEASANALPGFDTQLVDYAVKLLEKKGVVFINNTPIKECTENGVVLANGELIKSKTVIWTGGIRGNKIMETMGIDHHCSRVKVDEFLRIPSFENIFMIGDMSIIMNKNGQPYPPTAQMAVQQGKYTADKIISYIRNGERYQTPFTFLNKGVVASLGKGEGIGKIGHKQVTGYRASFLKQLIDNHYLYSIGGLPVLFKKGSM